MELESNKTRWKQSLRSTQSQVSKFTTEKTLTWLILSVGIALRLAHYLFNRSLWLDEAMLALNIVQRTVVELFRPLEYIQVAPVGFLVVERLAIQAFGNNEYALRLFPLLSGIVSLFLFRKIAQQLLAPRAALIALGLFAILEPLIYYSSEVKQYSTDVAVALLIYFGAIRVYETGATQAGLVLFAIMGAAAVWFSHPSVFVLAGAGLSLSLSHIRNAEWKSLRRLAIVQLVWLLSFGVCYLVSLRALTQHESQIEHWTRGDAFMKVPWTIGGLQWLAVAFLKLFEFPVALHVAGIGILLFLVGCAAMYQRKGRLLFLLSPVLFALAASVLRKYPFSDRLVLFLVPALLLTIAEGAEYLRSKTGENRAVGLALLVVLFVPSLLVAKGHLLNPLDRQEIKPVMAYVRDHKQASDVVYVYYGARYPFAYYDQRYGFAPDDYTVEQPGEWAAHDAADLRPRLAALDALRGHPRVWIFFLNVHSEARNDELRYLAHLDTLGRRADSVISQGAAAYLYDLSAPPTAAKQP